MFNITIIMAPRLIFKGWIVTIQNDGESGTDVPLLCSYPELFAAQQCHRTAALTAQTCFVRRGVLRLRVPR